MFFSTDFVAISCRSKRWPNSAILNNSKEYWSKSPIRSTFSATNASRPSESKQPPLIHKPDMKRDKKFRMQASLAWFSLDLFLMSGSAVFTSEMNGKWRVILLNTHQMTLPRVLSYSICFPQPAHTLAVEISSPPRPDSTKVRSRISFVSSAVRPPLCFVESFACKNWGKQFGWRIKNKSLNKFKVS